MILIMEKTIIKNLISPQEYPKLKHKSPYLFNFFKEKQEISYLGIEHSRNPKKQHYQLIEKLLQEFLNRHAKNKIIIFLSIFWNFCQTVLCFIHFSRLTKWI
jgi:hypothetical protein